MNQDVMKHKWRKFFSYYKPYKKIFFADMFFACLGAAVTLVNPLIVRWITGDIIFREGALDVILRLSLLMTALVLVEMFCTYFISFYGHMMGARMEYDMRNEIFEHYQRLSFRFYDNQKTGQLMSRITNDLFDITELFHHGPEDIVISLIKFIGAFVILCFINWRLALISFAIIPVMLVYAVRCNRKMKKAFKKNRVKIGEINGQIEDNLSGIRVVKSFANEALEKEKFQRGNDGFLASKRDSYYHMGHYHAGLGAFTSMITIIVIASGAVLITKKMLAVSDLLAFLLYITNLIEPIKKLINFTEQFQNGYTGYERFLEIISQEPDVKDCENPLRPERLAGDVEFCKVSFQYEEDTQEVIHNVNLKVKAGDYVALVGSSGAGKSTICSLIPRFYDVTSGRISIDGMDIREIALKNLRENIGIVQQDVYLFAGSVYENIRYGKPQATREEVICAAKEANAHDFIMQLPNGYDTDIGQRGVKLSGGQKQRLSIARVFLKNPPILIFDEATSALDNESEKIVQESLEKLSRSRTTFVIAHRLSTIRNAQRILVLTENGIEEEGTHEELLAANGAYAALYNAAK